jgi:hypothetical protein
MVVIINIEDRKVQAMCGSTLMSFAYHPTNVLPSRHQGTELHDLTTQEEQGTFGRSKCGRELSRECRECTCEVIIHGRSNLIYCAHTNHTAYYTHRAACTRTPFPPLLQQVEQLVCFIVAPQYFLPSGCPIDAGCFSVLLMMYQA